MHIQVVYSPYVFLKWAKTTYRLPVGSLLFVGELCQEEVIDDGRIRFVVHEGYDDSQQAVEILTAAAAYLSHHKATSIEEELSSLLPEWLSFQNSLLDNFSYDKNNKLFTLDTDLIHPIATGLNCLKKQGALASDLCVYIGNQINQIEDFYFNGVNTQTQLSSFINKISTLYSREQLNSLLQIMQQDWQQLQQQHQGLGFQLLTYNFTKA